MEALCLILGITSFVLAIQLGRIQTQLYFIEKHLKEIATHTSKEYKMG